MISIKEEIAVPAPRDRVWEVLSNPSDVVSCISGAELGAEHDDGSFDGTLVVKFGAIRVKFAARISLELEESVSEGRLSARGGDGQGATRFRGEATFRVADADEAGSSLVLMNGEVTLSGKLASLVESGAGAVASRMTKDFSAKLVERCTAPAELADVPATGSGSISAPAAARSGRLRRLRAWLGRVFGRRSAPPSRAQVPTAPAPQDAATRHQSEEARSGNAQAQ